MLASSALRGRTGACWAALRTCTGGTELLQAGFTSASDADPSSRSQPTAQPSTSGHRLTETIAAANMSMPHLKDQAVLGKVVSTKGDVVLIDPGTFGFCSFRKSMLSIDQLHNPTPKDLESRTSKSDIRPGDLLKFRLVATYSPYGELFLEPLKTGGDAQKQMVWEELKDAITTQRPVQGRILNVAQNGYAVGVAGYVALLPYSGARAESVRRIGVLQDFYITKVDEAQRLLILCDARTFRNAPPGDSRQSLYSNI